MESVSFEDILDRIKSVPLEINDASKRQIRSYFTAFFQEYKAIIDEHFTSVKRYFRLYGPMRSVITLFQTPGGSRICFVQHKAAGRVSFDFPSPGAPIMLEELWDRDSGQWALQEMFSYGALSPDIAGYEAKWRVWREAWDLFSAVATHDELHGVVVSILELFDVAPITTSPPSDVDVLVDILAEDYGRTFPRLSSRSKPAGQWAIEIKMRPDERASVEAIHRLAKYVEAQRLEKGILATTGFVTRPAEKAADQYDRIFIWDGNTLANFILRRRLLRESLLKPLLLGAENRLQELPAFVSVPSEGDLLVRRLKALPAGPEYYEEYQNLCVEILQFLFAQSFRRFVVRTQVRTIGGHEIRDALVPNRPLKEFWRRVLQEFGANNILFEFKNLSEPVTKDEVEQVRTYISNNPRRIGRFGILISRYPPSESALTARLKAYDNPPECLILLVDDKLLINMIRAKEQVDAPESVLEDLKEEFELSF